MITVFTCKVNLCNKQYLMDFNNNFFNENVYKKIKSLESEPRVIKNFLPLEEINYLLSFEKNSNKYFVDRPDGRKRSLANDGSSTERNYLKWDENIANILLPKLKECLGNFDIASTEFPPHFFKSLHPTRLHADTGRDPNMCVNKQIMIPLEVTPENSVAHTILFEDRWYGPATNFSYSNSQNKFSAFENIDEKLCFINNIYSFSEALTDNLNSKKFTYENNEFFVSKKLIENVEKIKKNERYNQNSNKHIKNDNEIEKVFYEKYLTHHSIEDFNSLSVDLAYEWKLGEALIWDRTQLHCSDAYGKSGAESKTAISIFTNSN